MNRLNCSTEDPGIPRKEAGCQRAGLVAVALGGLLLLCPGRVRGQESQGPAAGGGEALTLKHAVELALQNSRELTAARLQKELAEKSALIAKAEFQPNLYAGSGAAYTNGIPETPGGRAPSVFNLSYTQQLFNSPLKGQARELQERASGQAFQVEGVRDAVIVQAASAYLELAKVRHSLALVRAGEQSAKQIVEVTQQRFAEGLELPTEVTRAQLTAAKVERQRLELEGRESSLATLLRSLTGLPESQPIEVSAEDLPTQAEQAGADLMAQALTNNSTLKQAESERRARELRLKGENGGYWPTLELFGTYSVLAKFNNWEDFFNKFQRHNVNVGVHVELPVFSARNRAAVGRARTDLKAADLEVKNTRTELSAEVRRQAHRLRELDAGREVARLELQLAQQQLAILQTQFQEGRANLRDVERARLEEDQRWMDFLDSNFTRQQAQLELLRTTGQLARVFQ